MNAHSLAQRSYGETALPIRTNRAVEYDVIAKVTHRMKDAASKGIACFPDLAEALHNNSKLWTVLALDAARDGNALPDSLRAGILSLAEFTQQHTHKVLRRKASVAPLLEINTAILRGLKQQGARYQ